MSLYCRVSHSLKERNQKLARDSIEMDKVFREEIKRHDKQSTSELVCSLNYISILLKERNYLEHRYFFNSAFCHCVRAMKFSLCLSVLTLFSFHSIT